MTRHVVIIGNGVSGITAARFVRKQSDCRISVISVETDHFFSRTALMYIYMGHMTYADTKPYEDWFWEKNRIDLVRGYVERIDTDAKQLYLDGERKITYDTLVIATGSRSNKFGWPGQDLTGVQGLYSVQDLDEMERRTAGIDRAVVVGGGLIGIEMAEMLHTRHIDVTFLVREASYMDHLLPPEESEIINDEIRDHHIDLRLSTELEAVVPDENGIARAVRTTNGDEIACQFVGLTVGVHPAADLAARSGIETNRGVLVDQYFQTNVDGVYAIGDCAEFRDHDVAHRPIEQLWYTGRRHGKTVAQTICDQPTPYDRGVFFNSAKFFTVEYQTYGDIAPTPPDTQRSVLWQDEDQRKLVRINYDLDSKRVVGFNLLGVRYRHEVCEQWILEGRTIEHVLNRLADANFDPEFSRHTENQVREAFRRSNPYNAEVTA